MSTLPEVRKHDSLKENNFDRAEINRGTFFSLHQMEIKRCEGIIRYCLNALEKLLRFSGKTKTESQRAPVSVLLFIQHLSFSSVKGEAEKLERFFTSRAEAKLNEEKKKLKIH